MSLNKTYIIFLLPLIMLVSCASTNEVSAGRDKGGKGKKDEITYLLDRKVDHLAVQQLYIDASRSRMLEDYQKAVSLYQQVLRMDPYNDGAQYELASIYFESGQYESARDFIDKAVVNDSLNYIVQYVRDGWANDSTAKLNALVADAQERYLSNRWYLVMQADVHAYLGEYELASQVFAQLLNDHPEQIEYYFDWAYVNAKANKLEEALKVYNKAEEAIGIDEGIISQKQKLLLQMGRFDDAVTEGKKLLEAYPGEVRYYQMLAELYQTNNKLDEAIAVYEDMLQLDTDNPFAVLNLAEIYKYKGDHDQYILYLKQAFADPNLSLDSKIRVLYPYLLGVGDSTKKEEAHILAQIVVEAHPNEAKAHAIYGDLLYQDEQNEDALLQYEQALELDQSVFEVWQQVFFILSDMQRYQELADRTDAALELYPNQPIIYFFNGLANSQLHNYKEAVDILNAGNNLVVGNMALKIQFYSSLGDAYNNLGNYTASDEAFDQALKFDEDNSYVLNNYSYYLSLRGDNLEKAAEMSLHSNELEPGNSSFQDTYAWILFKQGKFEDALVWIEKAYQSGGSESGVILEHYGDILYKLGRHEDALKYWEQASEKQDVSDLLNKKISDKKYYE